MFLKDILRCLEVFFSFICILFLGLLKSILCIDLVCFNCFEFLLLINIFLLFLCKYVYNLVFFLMIFLIFLKFLRCVLLKFVMYLKFGFVIFDSNLIFLI